MIDNSSTVGEFVLDSYRAHALIGEAKLVDGTDYISFTGDFGFKRWLPPAEVIERHLAHEANLLSNFQHSVINLEYMLPGFSGDELDRRIETMVIGMLRRAGYDVISRANNHALDYGPEGIRYNTTQLATVGLATIGTCDSPVYEWETGGRRVSIYALTDYTDREDQERLIMGINQPDLAFRGQKTAQTDFRIAFIHLGSMSFFPSPHERKRVARVLDAGADLVICTGSHFIKGFITERQKPVIYGIGNHLFSEVTRDTEPIGMHLVAGFRAGELVQLFVVPFWNTILQGKIGPLDEVSFNSFKSSLLERSTTDTTRYFSDQHSLAMLKECLANFQFSYLKEIKPRYFVYALFIIFNHLPMIFTAKYRTVLMFPANLIRRMIRIRKQRVE